MKNLKFLFRGISALLFSSVIFISCKKEVIEKGIKVGEETFSKEIFFSDPDLGAITAIEVVKADSADAPQILVVGEEGSSLINRNGEAIHKTSFDKRAGVVIPVYNPESQKFDYLNRGGGWQPVSYIKSSGETVFSISEPTPNDAVLIDVDNDGVKDLIVGTNASGGLVAFSFTGERIWKKDATNVFDVEILEEGGAKHIVHTDGSKILIRSGSGDLLRTLDLPFETFEKGIWPGTNKEVIIGMAEDSLQAFNLNGNKLGALPIARWGRSLRTAALQDGQNRNYYGVVVALLATTNRSEFYVYNKTDSLIFHETIEALYPVVESAPMDDLRKTILVGGSNGIVWSYDFN